MVDAWWAAAESRTWSICRRGQPRKGKRRITKTIVAQSSGITSSEKVVVRVTNADGSFHRWISSAVTVQYSTVQYRTYCCRVGKHPTYGCGAKTDVILQYLLFWDGKMGNTDVAQNIVWNLSQCLKVEQLLSKKGGGCQRRKRQIHTETLVLRVRAQFKVGYLDGLFLSPHPVMSTSHPVPFVHQ